MTYRHLFVPVDGSTLGERAMDAALGLAKQLGASVTGFVVEPEVPMPSMGAPLAAYEEAAERHIVKTDTHARGILTRFEQKAAEAGVAFHGLHARTDALDRAIADEAERAGADMIVMMTHGRGAFGELLFGSHTKSVLSKSKLPLLVLH